MKLLTCIFFFLIFQEANGQNLSKKYIDNWIVKCDSSAKAHLINMYVIYGTGYLPADSVKMDSVLKNWPYKKLLRIDFFRTEKVIPTTEVPGRIVVILESKGQQSEKEKRQLFSEAILKWDKPVFYTNHIANDSKEPVLLINDRLIFHSDCYNELSKIKSNNIYAINIYKYPVPWEYFGQNAKNGLVQICTYKSKKHL